VIFQLAEKEGGTELTWIMNGKLPFVMFWMKGMMQTLVGTEKDFSQLVPWAIENSCGYEIPPITLYQKWDMNKATTQYTVGFPMNVIPENLPEGFITGEVPATKMQVIEHTGPYRHIGNAWSLGMMLSRQKTFKQKRGMFPFEMYLNSPKDTPENDLVTRICFPVV
jgi:predicted transcriptional regulator YdeE